MYSMKKASEMLGIPVVTIRAWENRYGIVSPRRSPGGHRLFSDEDIARLRFLKQQTEENGMKISDAVRLLERQEADSAAPSTAPPAERAKSGHSYDSLIEELYRDLIDYNTARANETIDFAFSMYELEEVFRRILVPVLYRAGHEWEAGRIGVAQEHFASQLIQQRFSQFFRIFPIDPKLPAVLAFCPPGEWHHIGLLLFALFLRKRGLDVLYLGPNTPYDDLTTLIRTKRVSLVAVSLTDPALEDELGDWIESARRSCPDVRFVLGGPAFERSERPAPSSNVAYLGPEDWERWLRDHLAGR